MTKTMKALACPEPWPVEVGTTEVPKPGPHEVLAETRRVGTCGSDVGVYEGDRSDRGEWIKVIVEPFRDAGTGQNPAGAPRGLVMTSPLRRVAKTRPILPVRDLADAFAISRASI